MARSTRVDLDSEKKRCVAGIPVISNGKTVWVDDSDTHTLIFGATGSKKTRLFVMPTIDIMIKAGESFIATAPKGELYERTAGYAAVNGYDVKVLNLRDCTRGEHWNPLHYPYELYHRGETDKAYDLINDFNEIVNSRMESEQGDPFWAASRRGIQSRRDAAADGGGKKNRMQRDQSCKPLSYGKKETLRRLTNKMAPRSTCAVNLSNVINSAENTYRSIMISAFAAFSFFLTQPGLSAMLSESTFNVRDLGKKRPLCT